ncbi:MAG: SDR family oxidoreductase [Chloroflexi bacterium]|nr:SDR family oxidoreductase [Chloroflexota bacterium]
MQPLPDKIAIVTGAGQGIGAEIAKTLAAAGAKVAVNDLNPDRAERTAVTIRESGGQAIGIAADVSNKFQCSHLIDTARREWGRLDILVNNAAIKPSSSILKTDEYEWQRVMDVNLRGTFFMSQLAGRVMVDKKRADENQERGGVIINIASTAGVEEPFARHAAYAASKAGVVGFTRECAREFAEYNIRVHAVLVPEDGEVGTAVAQTIILLADTSQNNTNTIQPISTVLPYAKSDI